MKAGIFFTGSGPIVILTSYEAFDKPGFIEKLNAKGISKFIAYEVSINEVQEKYGRHRKVDELCLHASRQYLLGQLGSRGTAKVVPAVVDRQLV